MADQDDNGSTVIKPAPGYGGDNATFMANLAQRAAESVPAPLPVAGAVRAIRNAFTSPQKSDDDGN